MIPSPRNQYTGRALNVAPLQMSPSTDPSGADSYGILVKAGSSYYEESHLLQIDELRSTFSLMSQELIAKTCPTKFTRRQVVLRQYITKSCYEDK